jgi:rhodanese-related sulfurtransferase
MIKPQFKNTASPRELYELLHAGQPIELLDVRTPGEYANAHVPQARSIPLDTLNAPAFLYQHRDHHTPIYVLCQSGGRARKAIEKFNRAGFEDCVLVEGGTEAWIEAGLPVVKGKSTVLPLMRQVQIAVGFISATGAALALTVNPLFAIIPLVTGGGLLIAGLSGFCGLGLFLAKMPWNHTDSGSPGSCCHNPEQSS